MEKIYPKILEKIPDTVDFSFISVRNITQKSFFLENPSDQSIIFRIENENAYVFEPNQGVIMKKHKTEIKIKIVPESATVLIANALIVLDEKAQKIMKLSSIAKYPYIKINKSAIEFGNVLVGKSKEMELILTNSEKVPAKFSIVKKTIPYGKIKEYFYLSTTKGFIQSENSFLIKIKFITSHPGQFSYETFEVVTNGGNTSRFSCFGNCLSLTTHISSKNVNFHSIELTSSMSKLIRLYNDSEEPTTFQIYHNNDGPFKIIETEGVIGAKTNVRVNVIFKPNDTMTYYERVFCLIRNHNVLAIDLYGSSHDLLNKSRELEQKHIDIFRKKLKQGTYFNKVNMTNNEFEIANFLCKKSSILRDKISNYEEENLLIENTNLNSVQLHKEMFWEATSNTRLFHANIDLIDFRFVENGKMSEPFILTIYNNSTEKIKLKWILNKEINVSSLTKSYNMFADPNLIFIVTPEEAVVNYNSSAEFKVFFKPNQQEYYFFTQLTCLGTINSNYDKEKKDLSDKALGYISSAKFGNSISTVGRKSNLLKTLQSSRKTFEYFDPPIPLKISVVGHSFPPKTQIFMPIMEISPDKEIIFPPCSLLESTYHSLMIKNNSDTPLYFKFLSDLTNVFRVHPKAGLIPKKSFNLICVEFCPKEPNPYKFPLKMVFNHDNQNMHTIILHGLCVDPLIEIEDTKDEIYFPPSFIGINTKKTITLINRSPIKINVEILTDQEENGIITVDPNNFEMEENQIKKVDVYLCPTKVSNIESSILIQAGRIYDHLNESIGVYNPMSDLIKQGSKSNDKRMYKKTLKIIGKGSDGELKIEPVVLQFNTVKVGFHHKLTFSIYNPTICNFYVKLVIPDNQKVLENIEKKNLDQILQFDFKEGLINSFCKKDVCVTFRPVNRSFFDIKVALYATDNKNDKLTQSILASNPLEISNLLKAELTIKANGDYPLIQIVDIRNNNTGTSKLWRSFNVDEANVELSKHLSEEEINFMSNDKTNKKIQDYYNKLKCIKFNFGKFLKKSKTSQYEDIYLTLKNVGDVASEFYFKFPDDISIKREIWMDPVEPTSHERWEYQVLKEKLFEIEPRRNKLNPHESCNIRFRYNIKEKGTHWLRVIFQITNGKPLIFELYAETHPKKKGILEIRNPILNFHYAPMGYMIPIVSPIEIKNAGGLKLKYSINEKDINEFNEKNGFPIFQLENIEGSISPGDVKYIICSFRPLTNKSYTLNLPIYYTDDVKENNKLQISLTGHGYHPLTTQLPTFESPFKNMPKSRIFNKFDNNLIQKCAISLEEIDFGYVEDKPTSKAFIIYNFSMNESFSFEFNNPGFSLKDEILFEPNKATLEPNSHMIIKVILSPKNPNMISAYEGEIEIKITWENLNISNPKSLEKENLFLRVLKKSIPGKKENSSNPNISFVESILLDIFKEIICDNEFDNLISNELVNQPPGLFQWTNNIPYVSHEELKKKIENNYNQKALVTNELNSSLIGANKKNMTIVQRNVSSHQSDYSHKQRNHVDSKDIENFTQQDEIKLEAKYMNELINKLKYNIPEVNEKILLVNEESKNWFFSIMENTIYNIVSEAVYGETDLAEKTKIFFKK